MITTWENELQTNKGTASIKIWWNENVGNYMAVVRSPALKAPKFYRLISAFDKSMIVTAKDVARELFAEVCQDI